ncbi:MAG TPA: hypothetical protein VIV60_08990 [Polyangiaceae bacterium]
MRREEALDAAVCSKVDPSRLRSALEVVMPDLLALKALDLSMVKVIEPLAAAATVLTALPRLMALRGAMVDELRTFNVAKLDNLEVYALALIQTHYAFRESLMKAPNMRNVAREASALRERLVNELLMLAHRGYVAPPPKLRGTNGYRNIANDVHVVASLLRHAWDAVADMTLITKEDLDRAQSLADRILTGIEKRPEESEVLMNAQRERQCAFTLLMRAYHDVRGAVVYLRWFERDANRVAPRIRGSMRQTWLVQNLQQKRPLTASEAAACSNGSASPAPRRSLH